MRYFIKNANIIDPARRIATIGNILIEHGLVAQVFDMADFGMPSEPDQGIEVIDARGSIVAPGFIDLHAHLREPGDEHKETIATAGQAAARGGFTTICAMPDTTPATDTAGAARQLADTARRQSVVKVAPIGAVTAGRKGSQLAELAELAEAGCVALSEAGRTIADAALMRNALSYAAMLGLPLLAHCEDARLTNGWAMHEGAVSTRLGLPGFPSSAEETIIARDIALAESVGAHLHICNVSTSGGVALIRAAKERGLRVTAEVTPHHLTLSERWVLGSLAQWTALPRTPPAESKKRKRGKKSEPGLGLPSWLDPSLLPPYDASTRVNPPLRAEEDVEALIEGLRDGTIDAIASGHSPQSMVEKNVEYRLAAPGISALETALALVLTLVHRGEIDLLDMVAKLTEGPASVLGRAPATLRPGSAADIVIFDPEQSWMVDPREFVSLGHNTPLTGQKLKGQVMLTMVAGEIAYRRGSFGVGTGVLRQASKLEGILEE
ncbi:MAG: dihydroorotase [Roseiflexaceae bacterium]|nr:dihydroorotase [Roseiflexaceae bacterium]